MFFLKKAKYNRRTFFYLCGPKGKNTGFVTVPGQKWFKKNKNKST